MFILYGAMVYLSCIHEKCMREVYAMALDEANVKDRDSLFASSNAKMSFTNPLGLKSFNR